MKIYFTHTLWAATLAVLVHLSYSVRYASDKATAAVTQAAGAVADARADLQATTDKLPEVAEEAARRSSSGAIDETIVKPVRDQARTTKKDFNNGLRKIGAPFRL